MSERRRKSEGRSKRRISSVEVVSCEVAVVPPLPEVDVILQCSVFDARCLVIKLILILMMILMPMSMRSVELFSAYLGTYS